MITAKEIFNSYRWANFITRDVDGCVYVFEHMPEIRKTNLFLNKDKFVQLGFVDVEEFKGKDWADCLVARKATDTFKVLSAIVFKD